MNDRIDEEVTFRRLEVLLAFLEGGSLGKAAEILDVSTVSVHRALHSLENGMRCKLFEHQGRLLIPTDAARTLATTARTVLTLLGRVVNGADGTGHAARIDGIRVAGKTGTAPSRGDLHYASFVGIVPAPRARARVLVGLDGVTGAGGEVAAPVFAKIAARALGR